MAAVAKVTLHQVRLSVNCHGPWLALEHFKIPYSTKDVDIAQGEQRRPEFLAMNPTQTVPVLRDGEIAVWDCNAILRYLANQYISKYNVDFLPTDPKRRAAIDMLSIAADLASGTRVAPDSVVPDHLATFYFLGWTENRECTEPAKKRLADHLSILEKSLLAGRKFIGGEKPSAADFSIVPALAYLRAPGCDVAIPAGITAYIKRFSEVVGFYSELLNGAGGLGLNQYMDSLGDR